MQKTCIVIPCYNEADRLDIQAFLLYAASRPAIYFLFVNDGSTDSTSGLLKQLTEMNAQQFCYTNLEKNSGKAASVREGFIKSFNWLDFAYVGYLDADLATPLSEIEWLLQSFRDDPSLAFVLGSRKKTAVNSIKRSRLRHSFGRVYANFITGILGLDFYDTQCGAKIIKAEVAQQLIKTPFIDRWLFDIELISRFYKIFGHKSTAIKEVVLREWIEKGHSRIRKVDLLKLPYKTVRIFFTYL